ncbi:MAG TPA: Fur family transcriptional regulator [Alphaproteobacteria bacterium]|jgi:Fur family iron response transcriptional regulator|nr:Fur family transcriptional regulator [Alphaproteobacteria bacterium]
MNDSRVFPTPAERLAAAGLRPTRQRLALTSLVFGQGERHLSAESLHAEALGAKVPVSLATVYNTLRRFTECGLLREVLVAPGKVYFDTNADDHHHFFFEGTGMLEDIPADHVTLSKLPPTPAGSDVSRVDVIIRLAAAKN